MLVPKCKPALFFRALPFISIDMGKRTCLVDVFFEKIELQCLIEGETYQNPIAFGIQHEIVITDHKC